MFSTSQNDIFLEDIRWKEALWTGLKEIVVITLPGSVTCFGLKWVTDFITVVKISDVSSDWQPLYTAKQLQIIMVITLIKQSIEVCDF